MEILRTNEGAATLKAMEQKRSDIIANQIEELIFDGTFGDDERLDEVQLSERFSVSRTPVREALLRLAQSGLVEHLPRRGVFVRQPGPIELIEMFEVMAELEATAARFAARRISDDAIQDLKDANARCNAAVEQKDPDEYYRENEQFHAILYRESGNGFLEQECLRLQRRLQPFRRTQLRLRGRLKQSMAEHEQIVTALEDGDGATAADAIRSHVAVQGEKFHHLMASLKTAAE
jgi:DNA-binding GntR family transcriptional regulator